MRYCQRVGLKKPSWMMFPRIAAAWISSKVCLSADQYFSLAVLPQIEEKVLPVSPDEKQGFKRKILFSDNSFNCSSGICSFSLVADAILEKRKKEQKVITRSVRRRFLVVKDKTLCLVELIFNFVILRVNTFFAQKVFDEVLIICPDY